MVDTSQSTSNGSGLVQELSLLLGTETSSLANHLDEAHPHLTASTYQAWSKVQDLAHRRADHAARLTRLIASLEQTPRPAVFAQDVAHFHFMTLERLLPVLIDEKQQQLAAYRRALGHAGDNAAISSELNELLAEDEAELKELQAIQQSL